jgi:threonylcarbamoyladenosine tRNA methylthiotransferase MtaB
VPQARGRSRSLGMEDVVRAVEEMNQQGYREIVLTGIHAGAYGLDHEPKGSLPGLIDGITEKYPDIRIRLSSIEPQEVSNELLALIKERNICQHLHIPLQSGSDRILKLMNRGYNTNYYQQLINRIITELPDISIGTDIVTGFPGESDKDFRHTVKFIEQLPMSYMHVFPYSKRPGTNASLMSDQINDKEKKLRVKNLIKISSNMKKAYISRFLGRVLDVIVEKRDVTTGYYNAISSNYLRVYVRSEGMRTGSLLKVRAGSIVEAGLLAEPLN